MAKKEGRRRAPDSPHTAAYYVRRSAQAVRASGAHVSQYRAEYQALISWAENSARLLPFDYIEQFKAVSQGAEHYVFHDALNGLAMKATHPNKFGHSPRGDGSAATPVEYLRRLGWHNVLFGDDIRVVGIAHEEGQMEIFTSQPWITGCDDRPLPTKDEIDDYFSARTFVNATVYPDAPIYFSPRFGVIVADAHNKNVVRTEDGNILPIDVVIGIPGPDLAAQIHLVIANQFVLS